MEESGSVATAIDRNVWQYLVDVTSGAYDPAVDTCDLREERVAALRIVLLKTSRMPAFSRHRPGSPNARARFRKARIQIARLYLADDALELGVDGRCDAQDRGRMSPCRSR
jgi:hypothetical protein